MIALLLFWTFTSLIAFSVAGEKMPWLTVHITLPAILSAPGRSAGWSNRSTGACCACTAAGWRWCCCRSSCSASSRLLGSLLGPNPPFQGQELVQLQATSQFLVSFLFTLVSGCRPVLPDPLLADRAVCAHAGAGLLRAAGGADRPDRHPGQLLSTTITPMSCWSMPTRLPASRLPLSQIEEISRRTTDGLAIQVAYDNETSYPYWWYLRNYPNPQYYGANPSAHLRDVAGDPGGRCQFRQDRAGGRQSLRPVRLHPPVVAQPGLLRPDLGAHLECDHSTRPCAMRCSRSG